jgi:hypothetical protein
LLTWMLTTLVSAIWLKQEGIALARRCAAMIMAHRGEARHDRVAASK